MNVKELKVEMLRHGDTGVTLARALNISNVSLSNKMNGKNTEFTQSEIMCIKKRYELSDTRMTEIFFADYVS